MFADPPGFAASAVAVLPEMVSDEPRRVIWPRDKKGHLTRSSEEEKIGKGRKLFIIGIE